MATLLAVLASLLLAAALFTLWQSLRYALGAGGAEGPLVASCSAQHDALVERKRALLEGLRELDLDHQAGKISDGDREALETKLRSRAREVLRQLDSELEPYREEARRLLDAWIADKTSDASNDEPRLCASCAVRNDPDAVFCKTCGQALATQEDAR